MIIDRALLESVLSEEHISEGVEVKGKDYYEFANGKRPSGRGHWMFGLGPKSNHENADGSIKHNQVFQHYGMFTDAQAAARKAAKAAGHTEVHVLS